MGRATAGGSGWVILSWSPRAQRLLNHWAADHTHTLADGIPLLALDMYEHAYHLDFGADANAYVDAWVQNLHWDRPAQRFAAAQAVAVLEPPTSPATDPMRPEELRDLLAAGDAPMLLDVCLADDVSRRHDKLPNAQFVQDSALESWMQTLAPDRPIVAYCMFGYWYLATEIMTSPNDDQAPMLGADGRPWPGFAEAVSVWARIAMLSFGGPAGQIAVMHRILVEEKRWLSEARFLHALNFCMLLPGPEAQQLTVYIGWLMHRTIGGLVAGTLFVLPGFVCIMALSWIYAIYGDVSFVAWLFFGLKAAVLAIVLTAVVRIGARALRNNTMLTIAAASFIAIFFFGAPFPIIIIMAALIGYAGGRLGLPAFLGGNGHNASGAAATADAQTILGDGQMPQARTAESSLLRTSAILLLLWLAPTAVLLLLFGPDNVFSNIAVFFSKMAVVTFGGAYAVLAYVAQAAVDTHGWLQPGEMLDGLGMAETTPGPLIIVTQFVGFMGAYRDPGTLSPLIAGALGGMLTTWVTFVPCFMWIFLSAPHVERLRENVALSAALTAITAAVVGVVLNLAVWFAMHVVFREVGTYSGGPLHVPAPVFASVDYAALALSIAALLAAFRFKTGMVTLLLGAAGLGLLFGALGVVAH